MKLPDRRARLKSPPVNATPPCQIYRERPKTQPPAAGTSPPLPKVTARNPSGKVVSRPVPRRDATIRPSIPNTGAILSSTVWQVKTNSRPSNRREPPDEGVGNLVKRLIPRDPLTSGVSWSRSRFRTCRGPMLRLGEARTPNRVRFAKRGSTRRPRSAATHRTAGPR